MISSLASKCQDFKVGMPFFQPFYEMKLKTFIFRSNNPPRPNHTGRNRPYRSRGPFLYHQEAPRVSHVVVLQNVVIAISIAETFIHILFLASKLWLNWISHILYYVKGRRLLLMLKVRQIQNDFFKPMFLPKMKEQIRLYYLSTCFRSFFGRKWRQQKDILKLTDL